MGAFFCFRGTQIDRALQNHSVVRRAGAGGLMGVVKKVKGLPSGLMAAFCSVSVFWGGRFTLWPADRLTD